MIFNDKDLGKPTVEAFFIIRKNSCDTYIKVLSKDEKSIIFSFKNNCGFNPLEMKKRKKVNIVDYLYWDVSLVTKETYYLFDLTKDKVFLTRLDDNLFKLEVSIKNPDMIYSPLGKNATFEKLFIDINFSFIYK